MKYNLIIKMNRSVSARALQSHSKSPSRRGIYLNDQTIKKQKNTTFHSPYKDGRPNRHYINPSFISSQLFYPNEYTQDNNIAVQKNYAPNQNDIKKQTLYRERMRRDTMEREKERERSKTRENNAPTRNRQYRNERTNTRVIRVNEPEKQLSSELQCLQNYRECLQEQNKQKKFQRSTNNDLPPYFEKSRKDLQFELKHEAYNKHEMSNWTAVNNELRELKKQIKKTNQALQHERTNRMIREHQDILVQQEQRQRRQAELLGNILREQIRVNEVRKEKKWNY